MSQRRACELIIKAIGDEHEAVTMYRNLFDQITDVTDKIEKNYPGEGAKILTDIQNITQDQIRHEIIFKNMAIKVGCYISQ